MAGEGADFLSGVYIPKDKRFFSSRSDGLAVWRKSHSIHFFLGITECADFPGRLWRVGDLSVRRWVNSSRGRGRLWRFGALSLLLCLTTNRSRGRLWRVGDLSVRR